MEAITKRDIIENLLHNWIANNEVIESEIREKLENENKDGFRIGRKIGFQEDRLRKLFYMLWGEKIRRKSKGARAAEILAESQHLLVYHDGDEWKSSLYGNIFNMLVYIVAKGLDHVYGHREDNIEKLMNEVRKRWREEDAELRGEGIE